MTELITLEQRPIIKFDALETRGLEVQEQIRQLNIDSIESNEENRSMMKKIRASLNKELAVFEDQRKMIHGLITKPYAEFTASYNDNIKIVYEDASERLAEKIKVVEDKIIENKTADISTYFNSRNQFNFIGIERLKLKINLSATQKKLEKTVDDFLLNIANDVSAIEKMENSVRIMSLYEQSLKLADSIANVNSDIEKEKRLEQAKKEREERLAIEAKEREEREKLAHEREVKERLERKKQEEIEAKNRRIQAEKTAELNKSKEAELEAVRLKEAEKQAIRDAELAQKEQEKIKQEKIEQVAREKAESAIHTMSFTVKGTIKQLKSIKSILEEMGVDYE